jgi:NADH:ubiquinone oxidoreductase subunit F (NADH-binding)
VAKYFVAFLVDESCGKCVPCREGLVQMLDILTGITEGDGRDKDIAKLEELGTFIKQGSLWQERRQSRALYAQILPARIRDAHP